MHFFLIKSSYESDNATNVLTKNLGRFLAEISIHFFINFKH